MPAALALIIQLLPYLPTLEQGAVAAIHGIIDAISGGNEPSAADVAAAEAALAAAQAGANQADAARKAIDQQIKGS